MCANRFLCALTLSMSVTEPTVLKLTLLPDKNSCTKFHENPANGLVADIMPSTGGEADGRT
jgi:hypothetical protein